MIKIYDVSVSEHCEAGNMVTFRCPKCYEEVSIAQYGWWKSKCSCGFVWGTEFYAYTEDDESEE